MTNKIEQEFYKYYEIEKRCLHPKECRHKGICRGVVACEHYTHPPITDRILLKLLCLLVNNVSPITFIAGEEDIGIKNIKNLILEACIKSYEIKEQVQQLFKEE